jgi:hypothetical protein
VMDYKAAFTKLGYYLRNHRQDWSAEKSEAVCITIWKLEIDWPTMVMDSRVSGSDIAIWGGKQGNKKRTAHAKRALTDFGGWIDAILVDGIPGVSYGKAFVWIPEERENRFWRVTFLDEITGQLRLEAQLR